MEGFNDELDDDLATEDDFVEEDGEEVCSLAVDECPNEFYIVNDSCECECQIVCAAIFSVDLENCACVPF